MLSFEEHYSQYLGFDINDDRQIVVCHSPLRDKIESFRVPLITAGVNKKQRVFSVSHDLMQLMGAVVLKQRGNDLSEIEWCQRIDDLLFGHFYTFHIHRFQRMTVESETLVNPGLDVNIVTKLTEGELKLLQNNKKKAFDTRGEKRREQMAERDRKIVSDGRYFAVLLDGSIASRASVDPVECGGGNIGVVTEPKYRGKGYGRAVVFQATNWCLENNIIPIYWVDMTNTTSVKLAEDLGFEKMSEEIIVKHWPGDAWEDYRAKTGKADN